MTPRGTNTPAPCCYYVFSCLSSNRWTNFCRKTLLDSSCVSIPYIKANLLQYQLQTKTKKVHRTSQRTRPVNETIKQAMNMYDMYVVRIKLQTSHSKWRQQKKKKSTCRYDYKMTMDAAILNLLVVHGVQSHFTCCHLIPPHRRLRSPSLFISAPWRIPSWRRRRKSAHLSTFAAHHARATSSSDWSCPICIKEKRNRDKTNLYS
jgi:hypothetical protein